MSMHIQSAFKVNAQLHEAWRLLTDLEHVAPCFPGAGHDDERACQGGRDHPRQIVNQ